MIAQLRTATLMLICLTILTGGLYPMFVTLVAQTAFPHQANGSLMIQQDRAVGSELIGQNFSSPKYFWGRLSATRPVPYNAAASGGSNFGPLHPDLHQAALDRVAMLKTDADPEKAVPNDLVAASGSGLDPHISPAAADYQIPRVAKARGMSENQVRELVAQFVLERQLGVLGERRVHVLKLNLALDERQNRE